MSASTFCAAAFHAILSASPVALRLDDDVPDAMQVAGGWEGVHALFGEHRGLVWLAIGAVLLLAASVFQPRSTPEEDRAGRVDDPGRGSDARLRRAHAERGDEPMAGFYGELLTELHAPAPGPAVRPAAGPAAARRRDLPMHSGVRAVLRLPAGAQAPALENLRPARGERDVDQVSAPHSASHSSGVDGPVPATRG
ncbi:MAG: hypothetical protein IT458_15795 [Planctomycetes bacterium]|nr:hypothetical protein [Planctomycetota bacterium]